MRQQIGRISTKDKLNNIHYFLVFQEYEEYYVGGSPEPQYQKTFKTIESQNGQTATLIDNNTYIEILETGEYFTVYDISIEAPS